LAAAAMAGGAGEGVSPSAALKDQGNEQFKSGNYLKAAALYTQAIKLDPDNATLYRFRSPPAPLPHPCLPCGCSSYTRGRSRCFLLRGSGGVLRHMVCCDVAFARLAWGDEQIALCGVTDRGAFLGLDRGLRT